MENLDKWVGIATNDIPVILENFEIFSIRFTPLILKNISRMRKIHYNNPQVEKEDLHQEGLMALYESIKNFNPERGVYFGVYLKVAISNRMKCFIRNYTPHRYTKDHEETVLKGKPTFKRIPINVTSIDDGQSYLW
jgi:DNA-directed RNA polymerase specialized sigma subunit